MKSKIFTFLLILLSTPLLACTCNEAQPSHQVPQNEFEELALILTKYGHNAEGLPALHFAILQNDIAAFELLIKHGASPFMASEPNKQYPKDCLHFALKAGNLELVQRLIELGLDPNKELSDSMALRLAIEWDRNEIIKYLVGIGVTLDYENKDHNYLYHCTIRGNLEIFNLLLSKGVTVNPKYRDWYPQGLACIPTINSDPTLPEDFQTNKIEMLTYLLDHKLINPNDFFEENAFILWESQNYFDLQKEMITILIRYGADINHRNKKGNTPLKLAKGHRMSDLLLSLGAK